MQKEKYSSPEFEVIFFDRDDVIRTSGGDTITEPMSAAPSAGFSLY